MINNLKSVRLSRHMTQEELSRITEISLTQIRNIEKNRSTPTLINALKIKKALNCKTIEELFDID